MSRDALFDRFRRFSQDHVLRWWDELGPAEQAALAAQLESLDLAWLHEQYGAACSDGTDAHSDEARRAGPPRDLVRLPESAADDVDWRRARETGHGLLSAGRVGAILVAGGEATRLGFEYPKGMFPIGVV